MRFWLRPLRTFLRRRRLLTYRPFERDFQRHLAVRFRKLALFRYRLTVHFRLQSQLFLGRLVLQGFVSRSRRRFLFRTDVRGIAERSPPSRRFFVRLRLRGFRNVAFQRITFRDVRVFVLGRNPFEDGCALNGRLPIQLYLECQLVIAILCRQFADGFLRRVCPRERFDDYRDDVFPDMERLGVDSGAFLDERRFDVRVLM